MAAEHALPVPERSSRGVREGVLNDRSDRHPPYELYGPATRAEQRPHALAQILSRLVSAAIHGTFGRASAGRAGSPATASGTASHDDRRTERASSWGATTTRLGSGASMAAGYGATGSAATSDVTGQATDRATDRATGSASDRRTGDTASNSERSGGFNASGASDSASSGASAGGQASASG